ncbi:MAG: SCO family protein [Fluviicola sp.]|nr:SCO family protein [Fluviicola sp.]
MKKGSVFLLLSLGILAIASCGSAEEKINPLPILGERDVDYQMIDGKEVADTIYHRVPDFKYLNQDSVLISSEDLKDKIWIVDFFFTSCPTICPPMTSNMNSLAEATSDLEENIQFLSFSIDPKRDTPSNLRKYIKARELNTKNWYLFSGEEDATHRLAKSFFNGAERNDEADGGFGHTDYFALVDTNGHVRGIYVGTDTEQMMLLENAIRKLLKEEYGVDGSK